VVVLAAAPAWAQLCQPNHKLRAYLETKYREQVTAYGVTNNGNLLEILTSKDGETWSLVLLQPNGKACLLAAGEGWRLLKPKGPEA
jgi:phage/plasmid primase-like uncharacterized protein